MDPLMIIAVVMSAIVFSWIGYFLGNFFPILGKKKDARRGGSREIPKVNLQPVKNIFKKVSDYLLEREEKEAQLEGEISPDEVVPELQRPVSPLPKLKDTTHLWYDRKAQKIFADIDGEVIDLDERLSPDMHSRLSFLLVDLQDKVGVSAALQAVIADREEEAFPEDEEEEQTKGSGFRPLKAFVDYIQSDVPKLEDKPDSIPSQINAILQRMIKDTDLIERGISVSEWPERGVVFIVGVDVYNDIHEVPDPEVRAVIHKAVKEWEEREEKE
jgi:hypothetical protein